MPASRSRQLCLCNPILIGASADRGSRRPAPPRRAAAGARGNKEGLVPLEEMDQLSLTASIITVASLAASTCCAFHHLRTACKTLPGRLHTLTNEVTDLERVLRHVAFVAEERARDPIFADRTVHIPHLLRQAQVKLDELQTIVRRITEVCQKTKGPLFRIHAWRKDRPRLQALQEDVKTVKCSVNIILGASNSYVPNADLGFDPFHVSMKSS